MNFSRIFVQNSGTAFEENVSDLTSFTDQTVQVINAGPTEPTNGAAEGETINTSADVGNSLDVTDYDNIRLAFRDSTVEASLDQSPLIPTSDLEVSLLSYAAPQQQVSEVQLPTTATVDETWRVKVTNEESGNQPFPRRSFEVTAEASDSTENVVDKFVSTINNAPDSAINDFNPVTVTASKSGTDTLVLTADGIGDIFDVATDGFEEVSLSVTTNPTDGVGTYEQVSKYEEDDRGTSGRYVQNTNLLGSLPEPPAYADPNGQYTLHTFQFPGDSEKAVNKSIARMHYIVALESAVMANQTEANSDANTDDYVEFFNPVVVASG